MGYCVAEGLGDPTVWVETTICAEQGKVPRSGKSGHFGSLDGSHLLDAKYEYILHLKDLSH